MEYYAKRSPVSFSSLRGLVFKEVTNEEDELLRFVTDDGTVYEMYHDQDCCEHVRIESVVGELSDLVGSPILVAEESQSNENPEGVPIPEYQDSFTWTFYKLATRKGFVDIRWYGESNGYYSESVSLYRLKKD